jgi:ApbE superfamily uncharacterized protein (UPF0280 family)
VTTYSKSSFMPMLAVAGCVAVFAIMMLHKPHTASATVDSDPLFQLF